MCDNGNMSRLGNKNKYIKTTSQKLTTFFFHITFWLINCETFFPIFSTPSNLIIYIYIYIYIYLLHVT